MGWLSIRNRCCTRSWMQKLQAASSGSGRVVVVVVVGGVVGVVVGVCSVVVVEVLVVLVVVVDGADVVVVVLVVTMMGHRLRSCGSSTMSGTGGLSIPSRWTVSVSSIPMLFTTVFVPARRPIPFSKVNVRSNSSWMSRAVPSS